MEGNLTQFKNESNQLIEQAEKYEVTNQANYNMAGNFLKTCLTMKQRIELFFEPTLIHFKNAKKEAEAGRKDTELKLEKYCEPIEKAIGIVRQKCKDFENEKIRLQEIEQKRLEEEAKKKVEVEKKWGEENPQVEVEKAKPVFEKESGLGIRRVWKWKVINLELVPKQYFVLDEVAINKVVREQKENTKIEGLEIYYD